VVESGVVQRVSLYSETTKGRYMMEREREIIFIIESTRLGGDGLRRPDAGMGVVARTFRDSTRWGNVRSY
jgi:hypothetical protein